MATRTAEAHPVQFIDRVVDAPVEKEPGDVGDFHEAQSATAMRKRSLTFLLMVLRGLLFKSRQLKTLRDVMTQKVKVFCFYAEYLDVPYANPAMQTEEKIEEVQWVQTIERIVEVLQIECQEVLRHVTAQQSQEAIRQVTFFPRWCLRFTSDPIECVFVDPSTMLPGIAFHGPISQTHASKSTTKDC